MLSYVQSIKYKSGSQIQHRQSSFRAELIPGNWLLFLFFFVQKSLIENYLLGEQQDIVGASITTFTIAWWFNLRPSYSNRKFVLI